MIERPTATVQLLQQLSHALQLQPLNRQMASQTIFPYSYSQAHIPAGLFNPHYPHSLQVLAAPQRFDATQLPPQTQALVLEQDYPLDSADWHQLTIPCFHAPLSAAALIQQLNQHVHAQCAARHFQHGNLVNVQGAGLLILGAPGSGKSSLSLALLQAGERLIADDAVYLYDDGSQLIGHGTAMLPPRHLHQRHQGLIDLQQQFSSHQLQAAQRLDAVIRIAQHKRPAEPTSPQPDSHWLVLAGRQFAVLELETVDQQACDLVRDFAQRRQIPAETDELATYTPLFATFAQVPAG